MQLLIATENEHKLREISRLFADMPQIHLVSLRDYSDLKLPPETGLTMRENARIKADYCARATGLPSLADDSGIEVDALNGEPGVYSARWAEGSDADRMHALVARVKDVPVESRTARYRCAVCLSRLEPANSGNQSNSTENDLIREEVEAICEGRIIDTPRGHNGFGYDPVFEIIEATGTGEQWIGYTMAEVPPGIKAQVSHRARAVAAIKPYLLALV